MFDPILKPSKYEGELFNIEPKLHPSTGNVQATTAEKAQKVNSFDTIDTMLDYAGELGFVGSAVNTTGKWINAIVNGEQTENGKERECAKAGVNMLSNGFSGIGDLAENAYRPSEMQNKGIFGGDWKSNAIESLTKATVKYGDEVNTKWGAMVLQEIDENWKPSKLKNVGENIKVVTNWTGFVLDGVMSGIDNYSEFEKSGGIKNARFWAETVGETAVDTALDIAAMGAAGVIVGAGAAALGFATAPVALVGVAAVGITWGVNAITEGITGAILGEKKDFSEAVVDLVLDTGSAMVDVGKNLVSSVGNIIGNIGVAWKECLG